MGQRSAISLISIVVFFLDQRLGTCSTVVLDASTETSSNPWKEANNRSLLVEIISSPET